MIAESDRQPLNQQLVVWRGPLPIDPLLNKDQLADFAEREARASGPTTTTWRTLNPPSDNQQRGPWLLPRLVLLHSHFAGGCTRRARSS